MSSKFYTAFIDFVKEKYPSAVQCKKEDYVFYTDKERIELMEEDILHTIAVYAKLGRCTPKVAPALLDIVPLEYIDPRNKAHEAAILVTEKVTGLPCEEKDLDTLIKVVEAVKKATGLDTQFNVRPKDCVIVSSLDPQTISFRLDYMFKEPMHNFVATKTIH